MTISERFELIKTVGYLQDTVKQMYLAGKINHDEFKAVMAHTDRVIKLLKGC